MIFNSIISIVWDKCVYGNSLGCILDNEFIIMKKMVFNIKFINNLEPEPNILNFSSLFCILIVM